MSDDAGPFPLAEDDTTRHHPREQAGGGTRVEVERRRAVRAAQPAASRRRVEGKPAVVREPHLDPRVGVVVGDLPEIVLVLPRDESRGDAGRNTEQSCHQGHRAGEVLAVPGLRIHHEADQRRQPRRRPRLLRVREATG